MNRRGFLKLAGAAVASLFVKGKKDAKEQAIEARCNTFHDYASTYSTTATTLDVDAVNKARELLKRFPDCISEVKWCDSECGDEWEDYEDEDEEETETDTEAGITLSVILRGEYSINNGKTWHSITGESGAGDETA